VSGDRSDTKEGQPEPGARLTFNGLFDALARNWSVRYRDAQKRGGSVSYDRSEATLTGDDDCAWRQLLAAGVNVEAIWALLIRQTAPPKKPSKKPLPPPHPGLARLYTLRRVRLATRTRLPTIFGLTSFAEAGGLMAYGPNRNEMWRRAVIFVDKILRGAKPGELPVEQATRFDLVLNLKTAKALGLTIPPSLLARADQVIE
jgi:hypothetical protein